MPPLGKPPNRPFAHHPNVSTPVEISAFRRSKIPPPPGDEGLQFQPVGVKMKPAAETEAGFGGDRPAEE